MTSYLLRQYCLYYTLLVDVRISVSTYFTFIFVTQKWNSMFVIKLFPIDLLYLNMLRQFY